MCKFLARAGAALRYHVGIMAMAIAALCLVVAGCGAGLRREVSPRALLSGHARGGHQPLSGASVQLYAVSNAGDGSTSTALLSTPVSTDASGSFSVGTYTCPTNNPLVYLVALGGNPGLPLNGRNANAALMAALGPCESVKNSTYVEMNEITTVASVWPLAPFMTSYAAVGASRADAEQLTNAFALANQLVDMSTGTVRGASAPVASVIPEVALNTVADVLSSCVNSAGGKSGDASFCGKLFSLTRNNLGVAPTNTVDAALNMASQPESNVSGLFALLTANAIFQPSLASVPASWSLNVTSPVPVSTGSFALGGLTSPASVAESIFVFATSVPAGSVVTYFIDDQLASTEVTAPFWLGGGTQDNPNGYLMHGLSAGSHLVRAVAETPAGATRISNVVDLNVVPSINAQFSSTLGTYPNHISAEQSSPAALISSVATPAATLTTTETNIRQQVFTMYLNWGINPALDYVSDQSTVLVGLFPTGWQPISVPRPGTPLSMWFSPDAPFYHKIPASWPRVALPSGYIKSFQLNAVIGGDGIGFGEVVAATTDPSFSVRSEWYGDASTLKLFSFPMPATWGENLPWQSDGDRHMIFVDPTSNTFVSSYKTSINAASHGPDALYASSPTPMGTLGLTGGSNAAAFADLPVLIQSGEATDSTNPIPHAIGGPVGRTWAARVFPASSRDAGILSSTNSCTGTGYTNTGLVPYGGLIQLDPALDLTKLKLTLPAFRILQAMQTYGYYVMDFGCSDLDIYTSISEAEFSPYGGMYGDATGIGVQNEIQSVLLANQLYVVAPLAKKQ